MSKKISDEQLDALMKDLIANSAMETSRVDEIADSPAIWWQVQRRIADEKAAGQTARGSIAKFWRVLMIGVPAAAAAALLIGVFMYRPVTDKAEKAAVQPIVTTASQSRSVTVQPDVTTATATDQTIASIPKSGAASFSRKSRSTVNRARKPSASGPGSMAAKKTEIRTDFIALSYARDAESGQIVRVKVPSSMMVTLGLVSTVEKPSNLVDAEIIVGDDGLTRAIRFIR
jgi:hypothetical protein